ncbi:MAG: XrtA/PEP-CTERM system-associated ATPase [Candidatus Competibacter sp.]|nr:AAA family ATPase [Candidatus Competibacteraceae bacterium]MBK8962596.1 AAA family ATPase [Candidatus Competibacteraceae bacterium]
MYIDYYGFSTKPFQLSPDPRFFFGSRVHTRALAYLRYGLSQGEGFIVITGGIGTGKTTLVKNLFQELDSNQVVAAQLVTTQLEADELLRSVVASFGLPYEEMGKAALLKHFEDFLRGHARQGRRVLLVVDEAQNLPARSLEELRMLSNFQVGETPLLQSFLLGQEEFRFTLQEPGMEQLRQRVIASSHLTPLSREETRDYIEHRLRVVGWEGWKPTFVEDAYAAIYRFTQGVPRLINVFCDRLLLYGFLEELNEFSVAAVESVGQELNQNQSGGESGIQRSGGGSRSLMRVSHAMEQRLGELENAMESLIKHPEWQDAQLERMERRIVQLEPAVRVIRRQLAEVMRRMDDRLGDDDTSIVSAENSED